MTRRNPTLAARVTRPLAFADDEVNALNDWLVRAAPWAFWPARAPSPRQPVGADVHAAYLLQLVGFTIPIELAAKRFGHLKEGRALWRERLISVGATVVVGAVTSGAWDRRATRRRRPLRR